MIESTTIDDRFRVGKAYTVSEASRLAKVSQGTVRNWLYGTTTRAGYEMEPVFGSRQKSDEAGKVSFLELSELVVAARFRRLRIKLQRIREAHDFARKEWQLAYPFAHLDLTSIGGHVLARFEAEEPDPTQGSLVVLSASEQYVMPGLVQEELERFDYNDIDRFAERWHPHGRSVPVVVDPRYAGGMPTIAGTGIRVEILERRWKAGERVAQIAQDFELSRRDVEAVLQHVA